ncbi:MAG: hypothetical protein KC486_05810 [Myxococcales bacterium]|nr:hypothetical protein [Myxococcales bacterium]
MHMQATTIPSKVLVIALPLTVAFAVGCQPRMGNDDTTTVFTESDSDSSSTTGSTGPTTLGTTTSTVTTEPPTTGGVSSTTDDTSSTTDDTSTTSVDPCNYDGTCDEDGGEDTLNCLHDCGSCEVDGICDSDVETPASCPVDCASTECNLDGKVDNLAEQCDDGNSDNNDACTDTCTLNTCGDGFLNEADGTMEECDDGNDVDGDGCSHQCIREIRTVFITSAKFYGTLAPAIGDITSGVALADAHCQELAENANLAGTYMAWLSDKSVGPAERFGIAEDFAGRFEMTNGETLAEGWSELTSGVINAPIISDEEGNFVGMSLIWTNTAQDGTSKGDSDCGGWSIDDGGKKAFYGTSGKTDGGWTDSNELLPCLSECRLYCFQVE